MLEIGSIRELEVTGLAAGGRGVARLDGQVWFVERGLPGDRVAARAERIRSGFVEALACTTEKPSDLRRASPCPAQSRCGGCPWMPLPEELQAEWKFRLVREALTRIGRGDADCVEPLRRPGPSLGYRNRVEFTLGHDPQGVTVLGLHGSPHAVGLVDVDRCLLQDDGANALLSRVRRLLLESGVASATRSAGPWRVVLRRSASSGEFLVVLREDREPFPGGRELARRLIEGHPEVAGVVAVRARPGQRGGTRRLWAVGSSVLEEQLAGRTFRLPASTFVQAHAAGNQALLDAVAECAGELSGLRLLDLYGGVGAFAFDLLRRGAAEAWVCDADADAIAAGRRAAGADTPRIIRFEHRDVGNFLAAGPSAAELVVANPPRSGLGRGVAAGIVGCRPQRIVLVSCDPPTLARDVRAFVDGGYRLRRVIPLDLFPQTAHVESVACLERSDG